MADPLHCSFCLKSQHEVAKLIAGPGAIYICDACVGLCNEWGRSSALSRGRATSCAPPWRS